VQKLCNETKGQSEAEQPHKQALGDFNVFQWLIRCCGAASKFPRPFKSFFGLAWVPTPECEKRQGIILKGLFGV
jgi:hypothetical protein